MIAFPSMTDLTLKSVLKALLSVLKGLAVIKTLTLLYKLYYFPAQVVHVAQCRGAAVVDHSGEQALDTWLSVSVTSSL